MTDARGEDAIDGIKVDQEGNLYVCGPGGIWVLSATESHLGTLRLPEAPHNLAVGRRGRPRPCTSQLSRAIYRIGLEHSGHPPGLTKGEAMSKGLRSGRDAAGL